MIKIDCHCHSKFSAHPSEWFLKRIGARESYTEVEELYRQAKSRGMTHVTITDHNTIDGALELIANHPDDCFVSVESTTYFPENNCKVHVLCYDITEEQFNMIQKLRLNIYEFRDYLKNEKIACSVAHATYSENGHITHNTIEKLVLLFDVFEGINGSRGKIHNSTLQKYLNRLTPEFIEKLKEKHNIKPWSDSSWIKGLTAGSDDHAGLFIGRTYTAAHNCNTIKDFMSIMKRKECEIGGSIGNHKALAFAIYKIACDYSNHRSGSGKDGIITFFGNTLLGNNQGMLSKWWTLKKLKKNKDSRMQILARFFEDVSTLQPSDENDSHAHIDAIYNSLSQLTDDFFVMIMTSLEKGLKNGDIDSVLKNFSAALPATFMIAPFFTTMHHLYGKNSTVLRELAEPSFNKKQKRPFRILWFSDTVIDLNGVAVTMQKLATTAYETSRPMKLVTSLPDAETDKLPPGTINLPCIYSFTPEFYSAYTLRIPSILNALDLIAKENPDEIVISTPGPVGLLGFAIARVLGLKVTGIYHTDFTKQADHFIGDEWVSSVVETYTRWFFKKMDSCRVPSKQYIEILSNRGLERDKLSLFRRSLDSEFFMNNPEQQTSLREKFNISENSDTLMWAGRLGKEKNLDFLFDVCTSIMENNENTTLIIAGDGPEYDAFKSTCGNNNRIIFTGRVNRDELAQLYYMSDVFVFPSTTDTFGMVVLEAQTCGLPAIVTDVGGPQEIIQNEVSGLVVPANNKEEWVNAIQKILNLKHNNPDIFENMRNSARESNGCKYGWEYVLDDMMGVSSHDEE